jgi:HEAT repeat protein
VTSEELRAALGDEAATVRRRAAEEAARTLPGHSEITEAVRAQLDDPEPIVVETAAFALGERPPATNATVVALCDVATGHADALCREAAVAALGAIGDPAGLPAILAATGDKATVRRRAVIALAPFDGPEVDAALHAALEDRDWQVRQAAEDLLA